MVAKKIKEFNPRILALLCNWCGFTETDLLVSKDLKCSPYLKVKRIMCSGSIQPALILDAFNIGNDGVLVCGCLTGNCHYIAGNEKAEERIQKTKKILEILRIDKERLNLEFVSPTEVGKFTNIIKKFTEKILSLGPFNL
jgi:F420-non-reducing hydrogenase iron-sulfur subunit